MKILIHPDLFYTGHSGAVAARKAASILKVMGHEVAVFTHESPDDSVISDVKCYKREEYRGIANIFRKKYKECFEGAIDVFKPDFVFFIGGIVNTPVIYIDICIKRKIRTLFLLLVQDFYCGRLHAALGETSCDLCLKGSNFNALLNNCLTSKTHPGLFFINYQINQQLFLKRLKKVDYLLGSSDEQISFYKEARIDCKNVTKIPLFFPQSRVIESSSRGGDYFVILAQNRRDKGIHLILKILKNSTENIKIKILFYNDRESEIFLKNYPEIKEYIQRDRVQVLSNVTMTSGALEIIEHSRGVINPSIWATTTEFVLLEILGIGKPAIVFDVGIHKEIIINGENGILIKSGDFKNMDIELNKLLNNDNYFSTVSINARRLFEQLTSDKIYIEILNKIIK
jgi:glycosyltransferase involved in cell wall biosynthesis